MKPDKKSSKPAPRATPEPRAAHGATPVWIFILLGALIYWGQIYLDSNAGGFHPQVYADYDSFEVVTRLNPKKDGGLFEKGREVYGRTCLACHQANGQGTPGMFPPLVESEWVVASGPNRVVRIILNGLQGPIKVKGTDWNNVMVPWRETLNDEEVAAVATYIRNEWGNKASPVTPEQVKAIRDETKGKPDAWTGAELLNIPEG